MGTGTALVIVDIQQFDFEGGRMPLTGSIEAARQTRKVLGAFRARKLPVFHVRHVPEGVPDQRNCTAIFRAETTVKTRRDSRGTRFGVSVEREGGPLGGVDLSRA